MTNLSRRVQHYGWRYDYKARSVHRQSYLGPLPECLAVLARQLADKGLMSTAPDQAIVNEYLPGQGISAHIDCEPCFGPEIASFSLGDEYPMRFQRVADDEQFELWLPIGSVCIMSGPARYEWKHEIVKRRSDPLAGGRKVRRRRVSVTFRKVIVD